MTNLSTLCVCLCVFGVYFYSQLECFLSDAVRRLSQIWQRVAKNALESINEQSRKYSGRMRNICEKLSYINFSVYRSFSYVCQHFSVIESELWLGEVY